jgi:GTP-binding protein Era
MSTVHKAGFVNIIGHPNAGKSTLMNELLGQKVSIVSAKEQTTRHRILGMLNEEDYQIVFSDTPGILKPAYKMQEAMMKSISSIFSDADHILLIVDVSHPRDFEESMLATMSALKIPITVLLNKLDLSTPEKVLPQVEYWKKQLPKCEVFVISALHKHGIKALITRIVDLLPESPPYYPKDQLTDRSERFMVSEIVRRQIFEQTKKEIPYSAEVVIERFKEVEDIIRIAGVIYVDRDSQKSIIIGSEGRKIKSIGSQARIELERYFAKQIHIELFVKVDKDWRKKEEKLKKYGYLS